MKLLILKTLAQLYVIVLAANRFTWLFRSSWKANVPVISVGNILAGGTGKTPIVQWLVSKLINKGYRPLVVSRGYGSFNGEGDETILHRIKNTGCIAVSGANRRQAIESVVEDYDVILLDDGFQHKRVFRDLDIVLVDATRDFLDEKMLPLGLLREQKFSLKRADIIICTHAQIKDDTLVKAIQKYSHGVDGWCEHYWKSLLVFDYGTRLEKNNSWLSEKEVVIRAGIGQPNHFTSIANRFGANIKHVCNVKDHSPFTEREISYLKKLPCKTILMTEKDYIKFPEKYKKDFCLVVPDLGVRFLHSLEDLVFQKIIEESGLKKLN